MSRDSLALRASRSFGSLSTSLLALQQRAAEKVFPGYVRSSAVLPHNASRGAIGYEISSNLPFQTLLYYNLFLYPIWLAGQLVVIQWKMYWFKPTGFHNILMNFFYYVFVIAEPLRLWFGYSGNLQERVPDLAGCFLLTCFPQLASCFYFMSVQPFLGNGFTVPFEIALNFVYICLLIPEIYFCYCAATGIIRSQAAAFFLTLEDEPKGTLLGSLGSSEATLVDESDHSAKFVRHSNHSTVGYRRDSSDNIGETELKRRKNVADTRR